MDNVKEQLLQALEQRNLKGPDYMELKKMTESDAMAALEPAVRYQVAFANLRVLAPGVSKEHIDRSLQEYVRVMEQEKELGLQQFQNTWNREIISKEEKIKGIREEINKLSLKIQELTQQAEEAEREVKEKKQSLQVQKEEFVQVADELIEELKSDKKLLTQIL